MKAWGLLVKGVADEGMEWKKTDQGMEWKRVDQGVEWEGLMKAWSGRG